jgi:hypothetical protein
MLSAMQTDNLCHFILEEKVANPNLVAQNIKNAAISFLRKKEAEKIDLFYSDNN